MRGNKSSVAVVSINKIVRDISTVTAYKNSISTVIEYPIADSGIVAVAISKRYAIAAVVEMLLLSTML